MITETVFGRVSAADGSLITVKLYTLSSPSGRLTVTLCDLGARIAGIRAVLPSGKIRELARGFDTPDAYMRASGYFGAVIGRYGNRIGRGRFTLNGKEYRLYQNDGKNHLHGGKEGFDKKIWTAAASDGPEPSVTFTAVSPDMEEGYPGKLDVGVKYTLTEKEGLRIDYTALTDAPTYLNLTNHVYFNLAGSGSVREHFVSLDADRYLPTDPELIPTGEIRPVDGTVFDFRSGRTVAGAAESSDPDIITAGGIDHCFVFSDDSAPDARKGYVLSPDGRVKMELYTDRPCVQFYSGNFLGDPEFPFRGGEPQTKRSAFCLETQAMPDAMNHPGFTDTLLSPGETFLSFTEYRFLF
ncbi:MAG: galactose mutarotase [Clostridia bacterium]|nr:galactose mutarotase [Clostridia bacterium]